MIYPVHHIPGRLRIKSPLIKGNPSAADSLRSRIGTIAGVGRVEANPLTGSVLIEYSPETVTGLGILHHLDGIRYGKGPEVRMAQQPAYDAETLVDKFMESVAQSIVERSAAALLAGLI